MVCPLKISVFQFLCHFRVFLYQIMLFCAVFNKKNKLGLKAPSIEEVKAWCAPAAE